MSGTAMTRQNDRDGPLATYRYRLELPDALAYEQLKREWSGRRRLVAILLAIAVGGLAGLLEDWIAINWWIAAGLILAAVFGVMAAADVALKSRRARARVVAEGETIVEDWSNHLAVRNGRGERFVADETIANVVADPRHVFILSGGEPVILPLRAFEDGAAMAAFAAAVDRRSQDAVE